MTRTRYTPCYLAIQFLLLFADKKRWCQGPAAMNAEGENVQPENEAACRWCSIGALWRANDCNSGPGYKPDLEDALRDFEVRWEKAAMDLYNTTLVGVNETHGLPAVRRVLRKAGGLE